MRLQRMLSNCAKLFLAFILLFPFSTFAANARLISVAATTPFPSHVPVGNSATAVFTVSNISAATNFTAIDQSVFPEGSGLYISAATCGSLMHPGQSCTISVSILAPTIAQVINGEIKEWARPSADGYRLPFTVNVTDIVITPSAGSNGTISPSSAQTVAIGSSLTFTATPDTGYGVYHWFVDGVQVQDGGTTYTLSNITTDHTVSVTFIKMWTLTPAVQTIGTNPPTQITGGVISPSTAQVVRQGTNYTFNATANSPWVISQWDDNGVVSAAAPSYTLTNITEDHTITVRFLAYELTSSISGTVPYNGSLSPLGVTLVTGSGSGSQLYTATPNSGYVVDKWLVDNSVAQVGGNTYTISTVTANHTIQVSFKPTPTGLGIAVGRDITGGNTMIVRSADAATTWTNVSPGTLGTGHFAAGSCTGTPTGAATQGVCVAVGDSSAGPGPGGGGSTMRLSVTFDGGTSWQNGNIISPPANGILTSTKCTGTGAQAVCVIAGQTLTGANPPFVAISTDGANNFTAANITSGTPPTTGLYYASSCTGATTTAICMAAGQDSGGPPFLAVTSNGGSTWSIPTITGAPLVGQYRGASCSGSSTSAVCVASGYETGPSPILAVSTDGGGTWTAKFASGAPASGTLIGTSCFGNGSSARCVAVGEDISNSLPLVVNSVDGGNTWNKVSSVGGAPAGGFFFSASCSGTGATGICIAAGSSAAVTPLLAMSTDGGVTWNTVTTVLGGGLPASGVLYGASCTGTTLSTVCTASGTDTSSPGVTLPLIVSTNDGGQTWTRNTITAAPTQGALYGASNTGGTFAPAKKILSKLLTSNLEIKGIV